MPLEHLEPDSLFPSSRFGFTQVVTSPPGKQIFVSGQVAWDAAFQVVGPGDFEAQVAQALSNLTAALAAAGATPADVTMMRFFIPNYEPRLAGQLGPALSKFFGDAKPCAQTLLGVQSLVSPDLLIEIEAQAVVPA